MSQISGISLTTCLGAWGDGGFINSNMTDGMKQAKRARLLIVHNPTAGNRRESRLAAVVALLRQEGAEVVLQATQCRGDAERIAAAVDCGQIDVLVAAGGDGTINETVNGLMRARARGNGVPPLGIVPLGTANVLAAELGLSTAPEPVARTLMHGRRLAVRPGRAEGPAGVRHFLMMAGVGFDAEVVERIDPAMKRLLGKGAYVLESTRGFFRYRERRFDVLVDGVAHQAASIIVARGRYYAGAYVVAPAARLDQPSLHVCLFERSGRWQVIRYGLALLLNRLPRTAGYRVLACSNVVIPAPADAVVQGDGDIIGRLPMTIALAGEPLTLLAPPE